MATDYYELLGVARDASADELKRAYRQRARELHPDTNPDPSAEERFKEITVAYETLRDPERRARYDRFGPEGAAGGDPMAGFTGGLGDIFEAFFGGSSPFGGAPGNARSTVRRGADMEVGLDLSFTDAVFGATSEVLVRAPVTCSTCSGSGAAAGSMPQACGQCQGTGQVRRVRQSILGQMVTAGPCPRCGGVGEIVANPCESCRGEGRRTEERSYTVEVPAGVDDGSTLRLTGRGAVGPRGGPPGDLYVHLRVEPHEHFVRQGYDLVHQLHVPVTQAALGAHLSYETLDGVEDLLIPRGTQTGRIFRLRGRGVPHVEGRGRGDLLVQIVVDVPTELSRTEEELLRRFAEERGDHVAPADTGFFSKIRSAFK